MDTDAINKYVAESLRGLEDVKGRFHFNFDPESAEKFQRKWQMLLEGEDGGRMLLGDLEGMEEQMAQRLKELEQRLRELEERLREEQP